MPSDSMMYGVYQGPVQCLLYGLHGKFQITQCKDAWLKTENLVFCVHNEVWTTRDPRLRATKRLCEEIKIVVSFQSSNGIRGSHNDVKADM